MDSESSKLHNDETKRFLHEVEPLLTEWCIEHPHWRRSESDPWLDPHGGHDLLKRARALLANDQALPPGDTK